jgi:hypothetical protein
LGLAVGIGSIVVFFVYIGTRAPQENYPDCAALMWDRKHLVEARPRAAEQTVRECEKDHLVHGGPECDADMIRRYCDLPDAASE